MAMDNMLPQMMHDNTVVCKELQYGTSRVQTFTRVSRTYVSSYPETNMLGLQAGRSLVKHISQDIKM